eukprot:3540307-Pleurochrysis_carterae.AAC.1
MIVLYDVEITKTGRLNAMGKVNIISTVKRQSPEIYEKLPFQPMEGKWRKEQHPQAQVAHSL